MGEPVAVFIHLHSDDTSSTIGVIDRETGITRTRVDPELAEHCKQSLLAVVAAYDADTTNNVP